MPDTHLSHGRPRVTVATVTYNSEKYVAEAIESILAQEFRDFELLICDDCSTDRTWEIVNGFNDRRIRAIRNESNIGEYPNRNQALYLARGKYFMFIDGDDYIYPHGLGLMVKMMERFPKAAFASAQPPSEKFIYPVQLTPHEFCSCLFLGPVVVGNDFTQLMFRTESLRAHNGFDLRFQTGDTHMQIAMGMTENCVLVNGSLAWWRRHPGQASERFIQGRWGIAELARYSMEVLDHPDCPLSSSEKRLARGNVSRMLMRAVVRCLVAGRFFHAWRLFQRSGIPAAHWKYFFGKYSRPYLKEITGADPIKLGIGASALASPVPRYAVHGMNSFSHFMRGSKIIDRLAARRKEVPVIKDDVAANRELWV